MAAWKQEADGRDCQDAQPAALRLGGMWASRTGLPGPLADPAHRRPPCDVIWNRFAGLDQARAVAILAMMVFHFAPGVFAHVPALEPVRTPVLWFGRTATPAFVTVFGLTVGFVLLPRYQRGAEGDSARRLRVRAVLVLAAAGLVSFPVLTRLAVSLNDNGWEWLFGLYSVLLFYSVALALLPLWLRLLRRRAVPRAVIAGLALWAVGSAGYSVWPQGPLSGQEFVRLVLLSGGYGYCQMMGTALLAVPLGLGLRHAFDAGAPPRSLATFLVAGAGLSAAGAAWGLAVGEYDLDRLIAGDLRTPPRGWYFLHFGALAVVAVAGLELLSRVARWFRPVGYPLALFGQTALVLYTGHVFVLPALQLADTHTPLQGGWRVAAGLVLFAIFCGLVLYGRHRCLAARAGNSHESGSAPDLKSQTGPDLPGGRPRAEQAVPAEWCHGANVSQPGPLPCPQR